ncbi:unnamed protein product, partial [Mesorhabditis belari]|uniref:Uncharacterized protein n=1 Tax=Mesorhabditis belari TaxID=2138241 RepID=A0AAF3JBD2_9BILA
MHAQTTTINEKTEKKKDRQRFTVIPIKGEKREKRWREFLSFIIRRKPRNTLDDDLFEEERNSPHFVDSARSFRSFSHSLLLSSRRCDVPNTARDIACNMLQNVYDLLRQVKDLMFNILLSIARDNSTESGPSTALANSAWSQRENLIQSLLKQHRARNKILEPYRRLKNALKVLQDEYLHSKDANPIQRYLRCCHAVRDVVVIEKQYWKLLEIPAQEGEDPSEYVVKVVTSLEQQSGNQTAPKGGIGALLGSSVMGRPEGRTDQEITERIRKMKTDELQKEYESMYSQLYRLIKKYQGLRRIVKELANRYEHTRLYPIVPRYALLKKMIKQALRAPEFADICHEQVE